MKSEFSEFTYAFALSHEIVRGPGTQLVPVFPNLTQEGKAGGGYDVNFRIPGVPIFLQFKLAEKIASRRAREVQRHNLPLLTPYFRFELMRISKSNQHSLLLQHDRGSAIVRYAAPQFALLSEIDKFWQNKAIFKNSVFIAPSKIGKIVDDNRHTIS